MRERLDPACARPLLRADDDARRPVGHPGRVAGRRRALGVEDRLQRGELLERRVAADALVRGQVADGDDLVLEEPGVLRSRGTLVRPVRPRVLVLAGDAELARHGGCLLDHVEAVERRREAVEDHVVEHLAVAEAVAEAPLGQQIRRARHRLHATRHDDVVATGRDHQLCDLDRADRGGADLVDRVRGHLLRDARPDRRLARRRLSDAGLEHLAHDDVPDVLAGDPGALEPGANRDRAELRRRHGGEPATDPAEGRADGRDDDCARHAVSLAAEVQSDAALAA